jgi:hypothetical protein
LCTASWIRGPEGYELLFNRDESRRRAVALPPRTITREGIRALAPVDAEAGGTWIGVNEHGISVAILNAWEFSGAAPRGGFQTRGAVALELLAADAIDAAVERLRARDLAPCRGFRVLFFAPQCSPRVFAWDGRALEEELARMPMASSSVDGEGARRARSFVLDQLVRERGALDTDVLFELHRSHAPERGALSPCMHRDDAVTVSASHIQVGPAQISLRYAPGAPCETAFGAPLVLARARPALRA